MPQKIDQFRVIAEALLQGKRIDRLSLGGREYVFSEKQSEFISSLTPKYFLYSGGRGCGKSLALVIKMYLFAKCFPGIRMLLGRKNQSDIEKTTLLDFFRIVPEDEYTHRVKDGLINFNNGSQIVMLGLDAMQSGAVMDIKKAQQKTKSMNIGAYFIDQLEEIEYEVFQSLNETMRMLSPEMTKLMATLEEEEKLEAWKLSALEIYEKYGVMDFPRQGNMTTNPANFWGFHYFKQDERMDDDGNWLPKTSPDSKLLEGSMLDNQANLPPDFIRDRMGRGESYVRRFVYGEWNMDVLTKGAVFAKEHIRWLEGQVKAPLCIEEGCEIFEEPKNVEYRMGVDPSEGIVDPSSISVVSFDGREVAKFNGMVPIQGLADKVKFLYYKYRKPLIIPEANSAGTALIREIRDLRVYRQKRLEYKQDIETERLGFRTSWDSKQQLIDHFQKLLREKVPKIYHRKTIEEMKVFVWSNQATDTGAGASRGFHDDNVMAMLLAFWDWTPKKAEEMMIAKTRPITKKHFQYH